MSVETTHVSLVGMSGVGKTYWSTRLAEQDFERICCDDLIGEALSTELAARGLGTDLRSLATWKGLPNQEGYAEREQLQIASAQKVMDAVCERLREASAPVVVDTSGSLVYVSDEALQNLRSLSKVVYIRIDKQKVEELFNDEVLYNRPLVWGNSFRQQKGESLQQAMRRSFRELLRWRAERYAQLAHVTLDYTQLHDEVKTTADFLDLL